MQPIRSRDLRANIKEMGFDRGVVTTLELALDEFAEYRQHMRELTDLVAQCVDQVERMVRAGTVMSDKLDELKRVHGDEHGDGSKG